jgi:hypothetical protein
VKQPGKGQKVKAVMKNEGTAPTAGKERKDIGKRKQDAPQAKPAAKSKADSNVSPPKRSISEESVPNSTPISSAHPSPRSDSSTITPKPIPTKGMLRPPPGLLPPPGFAKPPFEHTSPTEQMGARTPTLLSPQPSFSELSPTKTPIIHSEMQNPSSPTFHLHHESIPSPSLAGLVSPHLEAEELSPNKEFINSSMLITDLLPPPPHLAPPLLEQTQSDLADVVDESSGVHDLLGSGNSFNVMTFLDGIMNDPSRQTQPEEPVQSATAAAAAAATNPVSLDPWNSLTQSSPRSNPLAAIIGRISDVEATTLRGQDEQHEIAGIPLTSNTPSLLTPSALQSNISGIEPIYASLATEVYQQDDDGFLEPDSFYSQLLGGE